MIRVICLLFVIFFAQVFSIFGQAIPGKFLIKNVYIDLDADTRYLRKLADKTISMYWQKESSNKEIECFKSELMKTSLFENFSTELDKLEKTDEYNLTIIVSYQSKNPTYRVGKINLQGFDEIDLSKFNFNLAKSGLNEKVLSLKTDFPKFENQLIKVIRESYVSKSPKSEMNKPWVEIQLNAMGELDILVMPKFQGCSENSML